MMKGAPLDSSVLLLVNGSFRINSTPSMSTSPTQGISSQVGLVEDDCGGMIEVRETQLRAVGCKGAGDMAAERLTNSAIQCPEGPMLEYGMPVG